MRKDKYRVVELNKLDRDGDETLTYYVQQRKWFRWIPIASFNSKWGASRLYKALVAREKTIIQTVIEVDLNETK